jgi:hypothetical protein
VVEVGVVAEEEVEEVVVVEETVEGEEEKSRKVKIILLFQIKFYFPNGKLLGIVYVISVN